MKTLRSLFKLKEFIIPHFKLLMFAALLGIPLAALKTSFAPIVKYLFDLIGEKDKSAIFYIPAILIAWGVLNLIFRFSHYFFNRRAVLLIGRDLKAKLYKHLIHLSCDHYNEKSTGALMSRISMDPHYIDSVISSINAIVREPITFFGLFGYALYVNWKLTLLSIVVLPLLTWVFTAGGRNLKRYITKISEENEKIFSDLQESFAGIRVIHAFRLEKFLNDKLHSKLNNFVKIATKSSAVEEISHPLVELLFMVALSIVVVVGGTQIIDNQMTIGDLLGFFTAFVLMQEPIRRMNEINIKLNQAAGAADRILEVLSWKNSLIKAKNPVHKTNLDSEINFKNVVFSYPDQPERTVLSDVSFTVPKGKVVALVGESGSGKSSLANLLPRLYDVNKGSIEIDGIDVRNLDINQLRDMVSVVSQDVFLFNETVENNIRCGKLDASLDEIKEASQKANADEFVSRMQDGYQTLIGDRGQKLSGGERQRLSIARAFLRQSPILILDEATSNLDNVAERAVQQALEVLMKNRTTLVIAHRLSTIQNADKIIVIKEGKILESGNHEELLTRNGEYAKFQRLGHL